MRRGNVTRCRRFGLLRGVLERMYRENWGRWFWVQGAECVYHIAALVGPYFPKEAYYKVNYLGTVNIIDACKKYGIGKIVMSSSPSTRFDGNDIMGKTEEDLQIRPPGQFLQVRLKHTCPQVSELPTPPPDRGSCLSRAQPSIHQPTHQTTDQPIKSTDQPISPPTNPSNPPTNPSIHRPTHQSINHPIRPLTNPSIQR
jgi:hypothetical protein